MNEPWNTVVEQYGFLLDQAELITLRDGKRYVDAQHLDLKSVDALLLQLPASVRLSPGSIGGHQTVSFVLQDNEGNVLCRCAPPKKQETNWIGSSVAEELCRLGEKASDVAYLLVITENIDPEDFPVKNVSVHYQGELLCELLQEELRFWRRIIEMKE